MKLVGEFLKKFNNLRPPHDSLKKEVAAILKQILNISIKPKQVAIKNGVMFIYTSSILKSVIQVNRGKILQTLYERLPKAQETVRDIR